jgi:hypothetical protein
LALLLDEHPTRLTMDELILVLHADPEQGDPRTPQGEPCANWVVSGLRTVRGVSLAFASDTVLRCPGIP